MYTAYSISLLLLPFCLLWFSKNFGPRGYGFGSGAGVLSMDAGAGPGGRSQQRSSSDQPPARAKESAPSPAQASQEVEGGMKPRWGGGNTCPKCDKTVYFAEQIKAAFHTWHRACFTCSTCDKRLDAATCCDSRDRVYCRPCYGRNFGPKGVGYGLGAGTLQTN